MTRYSHVCMHCIDHPLLFFLSYHFLSLSRSASGTSIIQVTASDADDPTYGNSARLVYTLVQGQPHFSVDPQTGMFWNYWMLTRAFISLPCSTY